MSVHRPFYSIPSFALIPGPCAFWSSTLRLKGGTIVNPYVFMTDSDSDLPYTYVDELDLSVVYMPYIVNGQEYMDDLGRAEGIL